MSNENDSKITVRRGNYDSLDIYEITQEELDSLKAGSPNSVLLNISVSTLSIAVTLLITFLTVEIDDDRSFYVLMIALVGNVLAALITGLVWVFSENTFKKTIKKIESRMQNNAFDVSSDIDAISVLEKYIQD